MTETAGSVEQALRLEALRLASHEFSHHGPEGVVDAAEEFLDFLLDDSATHVPNGDPAVVQFSLSLDAVMNLGVLISAALAYGREHGIPEDDITRFGEAVLGEVRDTLQVIADGAEV